MRGHGRERTPLCASAQGDSFSQGKPRLQWCKEVEGGHMQTLKKLVCVHLDVHLWGARKKLSIDDLKKVDTGSIPPETLASLGSKRIFPKEPLQPLHAIKKRAERLCLAGGTRFMGGVAVPAAKKTDIASTLDELQRQFQSEVDKLMSHYDSALDDFVADFPEWEYMLRDAVLSSAEVREKFAFNFYLFDISVPEGMHETDSHLSDAVHGLAGQVLHEVAVTAREMLKNTLADRESVSALALKTVKGMYGKLIAMSFLDRRLAATAARLEKLIDSLPPKGKIEGAEFHRLTAIVKVLADPDRSIDPDNLPALDGRPNVVPITTTRAQVTYATARGPIQKPRPAQFGQSAYI
jgi:hypothetical protein